ncbi:MAG: acyltransferase, partial [Minicystis sp.]
MPPAPVSPEPAPAARRIPSLDGLRAISILVVLFGHMAGTRNFAFSFLDRLPTSELANFGVRVFFVISGFLITRLLFEEHARSGTVSLRGFYLRRTLRIFPAFYVFVAVVLVLDRLGKITLLPYDALTALTYTMNFHPTASRSWQVGHLWSLSVEEQFYLLWPAIVLFTRPRG